ncbi:hypothetical protein FRC19_003293 [Serendipita sp. 401]|nr:hypothetical protein FRC19_003293 [Serendipita sp. 401]
MRHRIEEGGEIRDSSMDELRCSLLTEPTYLNQLGKAGYHPSKLHSFLPLSSSLFFRPGAPLVCIARRQFTMDQLIFCRHFVLLIVFSRPQLVYLANILEKMHLSIASAVLFFLTVVAPVLTAPVPSPLSEITVSVMSRSSDILFDWANKARHSSKNRVSSQRERYRSTSTRSIWLDRWPKTLFRY